MHVTDFMFAGVQSHFLRSGRRTPAAAASASARARMGVFMAATRQHVGKSTTSLGLLDALLRRVPRQSVGFFKPVGHQHILSEDGVRVDKDCQLAKAYFGLECAYEQMSPVLIPQGYTRRFIDGDVDVASQEAAIIDAWDGLRGSHPNVVVEGTGHMGVGSIIGLDNARVAKLLGLDVVLVCEGGLVRTRAPCREPTPDASTTHTHTRAPSASAARSGARTPRPPPRALRAPRSTSSPST